MRNQLESEMHGTSQRDGIVRRFGIPVVAAAAVVTLAIGGYALLGGDKRDGVIPAGPGTPTASTPTKPDKTPQQKENKQPDASKPLTNPSEAYRKCIRLVETHVADWATPNKIEKPVGKLAIDNGKGSTVVVANSTDAFTCNVKPDNAVSLPRPLDSAVAPETFAVANNVTSNVLPGDPGNMVWGGGALPDGITSVTYTFPDGHQEPASTRDGYWVMQYFSPKAFTGGLNRDPIRVTLEAPGVSRDLILRWGDHTCNQVSHGC